MRNSTSEYIFAQAEVDRFEDSLRSVDPLLVELAQKHGLRLLKASSKGWPGRTLHGRRWLKTYYLRVSLTQNYEGLTSDVRWDITDVWMYDFAELWRRTVLFRTLAEDIASNGLNSPSTRQLISKAIGENFAL